MKVAIVGSRDYLNVDAIKDFVDSLDLDSVIISGGARGVDAIAEAAARKRGMTVTVFLADWNQYGKAAGHIRNQRIVDECDILVAFWDGNSPGTKDSISKASKAGKLSKVFRDTNPTQGNLF